jgi:NADH dehydrogenase FAD-containing subunit
MGRPGELTRSELELLRWLRAHGPAGTGQTAAAVGEPTTNYGRQRLGEVQTQPGRLRERADIKGLKLSGLLAWIVWLTVHLFYLVGFQNRVLVFIRWSVSFVTRGRGARLIIGE